MQQETSREIVTRADPLPGVPSLTNLVAPDSPSAPVFWASWRLETLQDRALVLQMKSGPTVPSTDVVNQEIELERILAHPYTLVDDDGQIIDRARILLGLADGRVVSFGATSLFNDLRMLAFLIPPPWTEPLRIKIRASKNRHGGSCYNLELLAVPGQAGEGKGGRRGK